MQLEYDVFPDFYKQYQWSSEKESTPEYFTGRENYLQNFWRDMCNVAGKGMFGRHNRAFFGPRKLGKTAFLQRCYNVAFWEQDEVIPFYYCFPQEVDIDLPKIAQEIAFQFLRQAIAFVTKDYDLYSVELEDVLFHKLKKKNFSWFEELEIYWRVSLARIQNAHGKQILRETWRLIKCFSALFKKNCMLIIDEYQKTVRNLYEHGEPVACHESIAEVVNNYGILTLISGSQISMLAYEALTSELHNRIPGESFAPLKEREAHELIRKYAGDKGYDGIEQDVYKLTGGNPYYIKILFTPTTHYNENHDKPKKWGRYKDIKKTYDFEMLHPKGEVFIFWEEHLTKKHRLLNGDPPKQKGITLKILKYIAEQEEIVHFDDLRKQFPQVKNMRKKMEQLRKADLLRDSMQLEEIYHFCDTVLPMVLTRMHQKLLLGTDSKQAFAKYEQQWLQTREQRRIQRLEEKVHALDIESAKTRDKQEKMEKDLNAATQKAQETERKIEDYFAKIAKVEASKRGKASIAKGAHAESKFQENVKRYIDEQQGPFSHYQLVGRLQDINIKLTSGKGKQIDLFGQLESSNGTTPKQYLLVGEMKDRRSKVGKNEIRQFLDKVAFVRAEYQLQHVICIYVCTAGFWNPAKELLDKNNIHYGTSDTFIANL